MSEPRFTRFTDLQDLSLTLNIGDIIMNKAKFILLAAGFVLALAFTISCSSDDGDYYYKPGKFQCELPSQSSGGYYPISQSICVTTEECYYAGGQVTSSTCK